MEGLLDLFLTTPVTLCLRLDPATHEQLLLEVTHHLKPKPYPLGELAARVAGKLSSCHYFFGKTGATLHKSPIPSSLAQTSVSPLVLHRRGGTTRVAQVTGKALLYGVRNPPPSPFFFPTSNNAEDSINKTASLSASERGPTSSSSSSSSSSSPQRQGPGQGPGSSKQNWSPQGIGKAVVIYPAEVPSPSSLI